ncbi:MAG: hypothetical protein LBV08_05720 [Clostridiales bacterium]|nr:hypothetical protein [Clostridiales bacterium]
MRNGPYLKLYKGDIIYILSFIFLCIYILFKLGFYKNIKQNLYLTEQKLLSKKIMGYSLEYKYEEGEYAKIYYSQAGQDYVNVIKQAVDIYFPMLAEDFGLQPEGLDKVTIILYPNAVELQNAIRYDYGEKIPMGVYYGGIINLLSPQFYVQSDNYGEIIEYFIENGPVVHELTHYFTDIKARGNYDIWFSEGVALYYEYKYTNFEWRRDLKEYAREITPEQLKYNFRSINEAAAYRKSFDIVHSYVGKYGEPALQNRIGELK